MPPRTRLSLDADELRHLYVGQRLTTTGIASQIGCASTTVLRRLREFGIPVRPRGPESGALVDPETYAARTTWSPAIAYAVGIITTDGCLARDGRHLVVSSKDLDLLNTIRHCLGLGVAITLYRSGPGRFCYRLQWSDRRFHAWLMGIGLMPAKTFSLGPLAIPDECMPDFVRGCIDGDGSITLYLDRYHTAKNERYVYQRLYVSLVSASRPFIDWVRASVRRGAGLNGSIAQSVSKAKSPIWVLRYAKHESIQLLRWVYEVPDAPCLARKRLKAEPFLRYRG